MAKILKENKLSDKQKEVLTLSLGIGLLKDEIDVFSKLLNEKKSNLRQLNQLRKEKYAELNK